MDVTPKSKRSRRCRGSKKKKLLIDVPAKPDPESMRSCPNAYPEGMRSCPDALPAPSCESTPPRRNISKEKEDAKLIEWEYYGKYKEAEIFWASPQESPDSRSVRIIDESPIPKQKGEEEQKDVVQRKEACEPPQFLAEILAISEKIKNNNESKEDLANGEAKCDFDDSYSKLFDEEMNEFMIECSQQVEETILKNAEGIEKNMTASTKTCSSNYEKCDSVRLNAKTFTVPVKQGDCRVNFVSSVSVLQFREGKEKNLLSGSNPGREIPPGRGESSSVKGEASSVKGESSSVKGESSSVKGESSSVKGESSSVKGESSSALKTGQGLRRHASDSGVQTRYFYRGHELCASGTRTTSTSTYCGKAPESTSKSVIIDCKVSAKTSMKTVLDSSFDAFKESFLEDGLDLLSSIPEDAEEYKESVNLPDSSSKAVLPSKTPFSHKQSAVCETNTNYSLDDSTFFEDDVLQQLDTLESNVTTSQPARCTVEEIEKKRKEAKLKLNKRTKR